jgi:O-antigen biosynthesis protein
MSPPGTARVSDSDENVLPVGDGDATSVAAEAGSFSEVAAATWLSKSLLLVVGCPDVNPGDTRATLAAGEDSLEIEVRCISLGRTNGSSERKVLTAAIPNGSSAARNADKLSIGSSQVQGESAGTELRLANLGNILGERLAKLGDRDAKRVLEFVSAAPSAHGVADERDLELSSRLHLLRNTLRPRLPTVTIDRDQPLTGNVDMLVPIDDSTFVIKGWMRDGEAQIIRLTAVTPEGEQVALLDRLFRLELQQFEPFAEGPYTEPVDAFRFFACFTTSRPSRLRRPWVFEMRNETGLAVEMHAMPDVAETPSARAKILRSVPESALPDEELMSSHIFPAIDRLQGRARESVRIASVADYGTAEEAPQVSIIVPLYRRIDLVEHQLLQFDRDPEVRAADLIYVLDSPELESDLADQARQLARLYGVPFRVVTMGHNVGFGAAMNAGASVARGTLLLLLNSDVLPAEPGWLGRMQAFHDATPNIGALGPKLLYEDDSLQHAGLYFDRTLEGPTAGSWANMHYYKGLHKDLPAANIARPLPAVTAACLLIEKDLYEQVGRLPDVYVQGDYEDSELCLRLQEAGRDNWYLPSVELYHLEGSSYSTEERGITASYNRWLQTRRMGQAIEGAMARYPRI